MNDGNKVKQWPGDDVTPSGRGNALAILHYITLQKGHIWKVLKKRDYSNSLVKSLDLWC